MNVLANSVGGLDEVQGSIAEIQDLAPNLVTPQQVFFANVDEVLLFKLGFQAYSGCPPGSPAAFYGTAEWTPSSPAPSGGCATVTQVAAKVCLSYGRFDNDERSVIAVRDRRKVTRSGHDKRWRR